MAPITAKFEADFASFYDAARQAVVELDGMEKGAAKAETRLQSMTDRFSGEKVIQDAQLMTEAIERLGGVSTLTEKELERVGRVTNEAVEKMQAIGLDVPKGMQAVADATKGAGDSTESLGVSVGNLAASYITAEAAIRLVEGAYAALVGATKAVITSASEAEEADAALLAALRAQGTAVPSVVAAYDEYAVALQQTTKFSDDAVKAAEAVLVQIGGVMPRDMAKALQATTNLAAGLRIDLGSAAMMVAKAAEGQTSALQRAGVVIQTTKGEAASFGTVLDQLNTKFAGAATAAGETFAGGLAKLENAWDNVLEATGRAITTNATWQAAVAGITELVTKNTTELNTNAKATNLVSEAVILTAKGAGLLVEALDILQKEGRDAVLLFDILRGVVTNWGIAITEAAISGQQLAQIMHAGLDATASKNIETLNQYLGVLKGRLEDVKHDIADTKATSASWSEALGTVRGSLDELVGQLEATRGQTVTVTAAQRESTEVWERQTGAIDAQTMAAQEHAKAMESLGDKYVKIGADVTALAKATEDASIKQIAAMNTVAPAIEATDEALLKFTDEVTVSADTATDAVAVMGGTFDSTAHSFADLTDAARTLTQEWINYAYTSPGSVPRGTLGQGFLVDPSTGTIAPRAAGGPVTAGASYLVGERGAELFTPGTSGMITPNGGGGTVVVQAGAFTLNYPIVNDPRALDALARHVGDAILGKLTRSGARL